MENDRMNYSGIQALYDLTIARHIFYNMETEGKIPSAIRDGNHQQGAYRYWRLEDLPFIGELVAPIQKPKKTISICIYVAKGGGAHKTTFSLTLAKFLALHGLKVLLIPLDFNQSLSKKFGYHDDYEEEKKGYYDLYDIVTKKVCIKEAISRTNFPNIDIIPESVFLTDLETLVQTKSFREHVIAEAIEPIKSNYDVILYDNDSAWDNLVINAIVSSDVVIAPIGVDANSVKTVPLFLKTLGRRLGRHEIKKLFIVPGMTESTAIKKEILSILQKKFKGIVTENSIRKSSLIDEANFYNLSIFEYSPKSKVSDDCKRVCLEIWEKILGEQENG